MIVQTDRYALGDYGCWYFCLSLFTISSFVSATSWRPRPVLDGVPIWRPRIKSGALIHKVSHGFVFTAVAVGRGYVTPLSCMLLWHGPASVRNQFSRLHWPRGSSIPGSMSIHIIIEDVFGTLMITVMITFPIALMAMFSCTRFNCAISVVNGFYLLGITV